MLAGCLERNACFPMNACNNLGRFRMLVSRAILDVVRGRPGMLFDPMLRNILDVARGRTCHGNGSGPGS
eukprot:6657092-Pyramimonas_sp.AAC.1